MASRDFTVAVIGGGIGGLCTAISLGRAGLKVELFEQAAQFSEIGAGVALGPNAVEALRMMGIGKEYEGVADMTEPGAVWFEWREYASGKKISETRTKGPASSVHRARLLETLLPLLPSSVTTHFSSRVVAAENIEGSSPGRVRLSISRGSHGETSPDYDPQDTFEVDIAIATDGVKSAIRKSLGQGRVRWTGTYAYRGLLDLEKAVEKNGESIRTPRMWIGPAKHILTFPIEGGTVLNLVAFVSDRSKDPDERVWHGPWVKPVSKDQVLDDFDGWDQHALNLLELIGKPEKWALHELVPLDRWTFDRVTLLGDSAHASLPHNGAGAGQATEDAYVLSSLLSHPQFNNSNVHQFLQAYEDVRRPRANKQQVSSRESGEIYEFAGPMGDDFKAIGEHLTSRYDWIWDHDLKKDVDQAFQSLIDAGVIRDGN